MKKFTCTLFALMLTGMVLAQVNVALNFSVERGFYDNSFPLSIEASDPAATIRYTTDGSAPTTSNGANYTGTITVNTTTILRAVAVLGGQESKVVTHSYIFLNDVLDQPNTSPSYPNQTQMAFHSTVKNHATYGPQLRSALEQLPSVSIAMKAADFVDITTTKGIQAFASIELLFQDGTPAYWQNGGVESYGNSTFKNQIKKNFRFVFKAEFGETKYRYPIFGEDGTDEFDYWVLRAGGQETTNRNGVQNLNDQFMRDLQLNTSGSAAHGDFFHVYLNGIYWGVYNATERPQKSFGESYFGGNKDDWNTLKATCCNTTLYPIDGNKDSWNAMLANINNYQAAQDYLDVDHFIDYVMINNFGPHGDWKTWNSYIIDNPTIGEKLRFYVWDCEPSLLSSRYYTNYTVNTVDYENVWQPLKANIDFRLRVADHMQCNCVEEDGPMHPQNTVSAYQALADEHGLAYLAEIGRWSQAYVYTNMQQYFLDQVNIYLPGRTATLINTYKNNNLFPDLDAVGYSQNGGAIPANFNLTLSNPNGAGTIYYTLDGSDPRALGGGISATAQSYTAGITLNGVTTVRARVKNGSIWSAMCPKTYFGPQDLSNLVINELQYNPTIACGNEVEFIELYNNGNTALNLSECFFDAGIEYVFPEGATILPNDYLLLTNDKFLFSALYGFETDGQYGGQLSGKGELVLLLDPFENFIDSVNYDDKLPWPELPDGDGPSLELRHPDLDNALWQSWQPSVGDCGTPDQPNSDPCTLNALDLVINEVNYKSLGTFDSGDWIEIHNPTSTNADLSGWQIQDGSDAFEVPIGTVIPAGGFLVLVEVDSLFSLVHPSVSAIGDLGFGFSSGGEEIRLVSAFGCIVDQVVYSPDEPWPTNAGGDGPTLSLIDAASDNGIPTSWSASVNATGTPGAPNDNTCPDNIIVINEINYNSPLSFDAGDWLELHNPTGSTIDLLGWELHDATSVYRFATSTLIEADGYLVLASSNLKFSTSYPTVNNYIAGIGMGFGNGGEDIQLFDASRCLVDFVPYDDKNPWPEEADGSGPSLSLIAPDLDNLLAASWEASSANGTPGRENVPCPKANFATLQTSFCVAAPVTFLVDDNRPGVNYTWTFGNGNPSTATGYNATTTWETDGNHSIQLIATYYECKDTSEQSLAVAICNNPPLAANDSYSINEDNTLDDNLLANDSDPDADLLVSNTSPYNAPTNGAVSIQANGDFSYTPSQNFNGSDSFSYQVCDQGTPSLCAEAVVSIDIQAINDAPITVADQINTSEDISIDVFILANDTDVDGNLYPVSVQVSSIPPSQGSLSVNSDGSLTFIPAANFSGAVDPVTYSVCDTGTPLPAQCSDGMLTITVTSQNDPPTANIDSFSSLEDSPLTANVLANDSDLDGDNLLAEENLLSLPTNGIVTMQSNGDFNYIPDDNFYGEDEFTYEACDDGTPILCSQSTVFITINPVNDAPILQADQGVTDEETPINLPLATNDLDLDGTLDLMSLTLTSFPPSGEGSASLNADGTLTFIPAANFFGQVTSFNYEICDDGLPPPVACSQAAIELTVLNINDAPVANDDNFETIENQAVGGMVLLNDTDIEGDLLSVNESPIVAAANGTVDLQTSGNFVYTPSNGFSGNDSFSYEICDAGQPSLCDTATVFINILPCPEVIMDLPTAACAASTSTFTAVDQGPNASYSWNFGADATPTTSSNLTEEVLYASSGPKSISLSITKNGCTVSDYAGITVGQAAFAYAGEDDSLCMGEAIQIGGNPTGPTGATFSWTPATGLNNSTVPTPFAFPDSTTTYEVLVTFGNCQISDQVTVTVENSPLFADAGPDLFDCGDGVQIGGMPSGPDYASYSWSPSAGLDDPNSPNPTSTWPTNKTYTLTVSYNGCSVSDEVTVEKRDPPSIYASADQSICLNPDGIGVVIGGPNNLPIYAYEWTPKTGLSHPFQGNSFANPPVTTIYTLTASKNGCTSSDEVIVYVDFCNDPPIAVADLDSLEMNTNLSGNVVTNDYDPNGDVLWIDSLPDISPEFGEVILSSNGDFTYTPFENFSGMDSFVYQLCDDGNPQFCERGIVTMMVMEPRCIDLQIHVALEGAMDASYTMRNDLNIERRVLPGQTPVNPFVTPTPAGHPYQEPPWNYMGTEGDDFGDADYAENVVDWVLVSLRSGPDKSSELLQAAALLLQDGRVHFLDSCLTQSIPDGAAYVVIEHRHHIGVMSPGPVSVIAGSLTYDFRAEDSYRDMASYGQFQLPDGTWCLFSGDGSQAGDVSFDINGQDKVIFSSQNGNFDVYLPSDYNMDGEVNGSDKILWARNNGITSRVPR